MKRTLGLVCLFVSSLLAMPLSSFATTTINVPPSVAPASISGDTTLNLFDGGSLPLSFIVGAGSTLNIHGALTGGPYVYPGGVANVYAGTVNFPTVSTQSTLNLFGGQTVFLTTTGNVNISGDATVIGIQAQFSSHMLVAGGTLSSTFNIGNGTTTEFSGGSIGSRVLVTAGALLTFDGADFAIDNVPVSGLNNVGDTRQITLSQNSQFTGTLADGTPFAFSTLDGDQVNPGAITLVRSQLAAASASYHVPTDAAPRGVAKNQALSISDGGVIGDNFQAGAGSVVNIQGGTIGSNFEAAGNIVNILGGQIGDRFSAFAGSMINVTGGSIAGSTLVQSGAAMNMSGGHLGAAVVDGNGVMKLSGGKISSGFVTNPGSIATISGADFRLNGQPISGLDNVGDSVALNVPTGNFQFTGTLADGTPFAFTNSESDRFQAAITLQRGTTAPIGPSVIHVPNDLPPTNIRMGQKLVLDSGGVIGDDFIAGAGGTVVMTGGNIGTNFKAVGSQVDIKGGQVGNSFQAFEGAIVHITGGAIGQLSRAKTGSSVTIDGGALAGLTAEAGSTVTVNGGVTHLITTGATVNVYGGQVMQYLIATGGGAVNVFGAQFLFNGAPLTGLQSPGDSVLVPFFGGSRLQGKLTDGTPFDFLFSSTGRAPTFFDSSVQLRLTIAVPEPSPLYLWMAGSMMLGVAMSRTFSRRLRAEVAMN